MEYKLYDPKEASNAETIKNIECEINEEIRMNPEWFNSLYPEEKLAFVYRRLGFDRPMEYIERMFRTDPKKYYETMEVVRNWKL